jgi:hypothetical protein
VRRWTWWLGLFLGCLLVVAGIAETTRAIRSGDGGLWFWTPTLVGGGALVLAGTLVLPRRASLGARLTCAGCLLGVLPTLWTIVGPLLLVLLAVLSLKVAAEEEQT